MASSNSRNSAGRPPPCRRAMPMRRLRPSSSRAARQTRAGHQLGRQQRIVVEAVLERDGDLERASEEVTVAQPLVAAAASRAGSRAPRRRARRTSGSAWPARRPPTAAAPGFSDRRSPPTTRSVVVAKVRPSVIPSRSASAATSANQSCGDTYRPPCTRGRRRAPWSRSRKAVAGGTSRLGHGDGHEAPLAVPAAAGGVLRK